jgi:mRNA-degrading endonuclease RelE of RelBE toxin-antitoxin system
VEFVEAPAFTRHVGEYLDDGELLALQLFLTEHPDAGKVVPGTGGFRKLRWSDQYRGKGKRGGLRIIYYWLSDSHQIWLFTLYGKDEAADLTPTQKSQLRAALAAELKARRQAAVRRGGR